MEINSSLCFNVFKKECHSSGCYNKSTIVGLSGLNNRNVFFTVLETGKSKIKVTADWVPGKNSCPDLQKVASFLCAHMMERAKASFSIRALIPSLKAPPTRPPKGPAS